jgi:hypothetical protein
MKSNRRRVARNHTRNSHKKAQEAQKRFLERFCDFCAFLARQFAGEQMRQGLKPCDAASEAEEKPTRFLVEM